MNSSIDADLIDNRSASPDEMYLKAFFGRRSEYYLERYKMYRSGDKFTFNISPFLAGGVWFFYRKLWREGLLLLLFLFVTGMAEALLYDMLSVTEGTQNVINLASGFLFGTLWGFAGNYLYMRRADIKVKEVLASTSDENERQRLLAAKGGITLIPFIVIILGILLLTLL